jgi:hypothetical protein
MASNETATAKVAPTAWQRQDEEFVAGEIIVQGCFPNVAKSCHRFPAKSQNASQGRAGGDVKDDQV